MIWLYDILTIPEKTHAASVSNSALGKKWDLEEHLKTSLVMISLCCPSYRGLPNPLWPRF